MITEVNIMRSQGGITVMEYHLHDNKNNLKKTQ